MTGDPCCWWVGYIETQLGNNFLTPTHPTPRFGLEQA